MKEMRGSVVSIEHYQDEKETGHRLRYQIVEFLICVFYLFWPIPVLMSFPALKNPGYSRVFSIVIVSFYIWRLWKMHLLIVTRTRDTRLSNKGSLFFYDYFMFSENPALREIRQYSALSRSLDVIYNFFMRFDLKPHFFQHKDYVPFPGATSCWRKFVNVQVRAWSKFWIGMPIAQDVRTRVQIVEDEYYAFFKERLIVKPDKRIDILEIAGGQLQSVVMAIARAIKSGYSFDYRVVSIEPDDGFAKTRAFELIKYFDLDQGKFIFIESNISIRPEKSELHIENILKAEGIDPSTFDIVSSIGLGDYYYGPGRIRGLLLHLKVCGNARVIVANISGNFVERIMLHVFIQWPLMEYRSLEEWQEIVLSVFHNSNIRIVQTPHKIFNIAIIIA